MNASTKPEQLALHPHGENSNTSNNPSIADIVDARLSRRSIFKASIGTAGAAVLGSLSLAACGGSDAAPPLSTHWATHSQQQPPPTKTTVPIPTLTTDQVTITTVWNILV